MTLNRLEIEEKKLDSLFKEVSQCEEGELKSHLSKYLCVQASGHLENVIKELIFEYHNKICKTETQKYISSKINRLTNIDDDNLTNLLNAFSSIWCDLYKTKITDKERMSLNSIIAQRNLIAHGKSHTSNISYLTIADYYADLKNIVTILKNIIKK